MQSPEHQVEDGSVPGETAEATALRAYLNTEKAVCPSCGYDVRGCDHAVCPECASPLVLQLKARMSAVPYWGYSLLVNGWLFLWGLGGTVTTSMRIWQYHAGMTRRFAAAMNSAQAPLNVQQLSGKIGTGPGAGTGRGTGAGTGVPAGSSNSVLESIGTFLAAQDLVDQAAIVLFLVSFSVGALGLATTPRARNAPGRWCGWLLVASAAVFVATMVHYVVRYWTFLARAF